MFVYLAKELNSSLGLGPTIIRIILKYYNGFVNKLMNMRLDLSKVIYLCMLID